MSQPAAPKTPVPHFVRHADGSVSQFYPVPFMTLDEARAAGPQKMTDPNFIQGKIDAALKAAGQPAEEGEV